MEILEYCDVSKLLEREQYYFDLLEPDYNIAKVAGSTIGVPRSEEFKNKLSELRKGKVHKEETKLLMSQIHLGANNSMFGKKHTDQTKELIRLSKVGKVLDINLWQPPLKPQPRTTYAVQRWSIRPALANPLFYWSTYM